MVILGLIGGIQEDIYNLNVSDSISSVFQKGPFLKYHTISMKARLPVGNKLLLDGKQFSTKEEVQLNKDGWYVEEKCVPRQPTFPKQYGNEVFRIPISESTCVEGFQQSSKTKSHISTYLLILSTLFVIGCICMKKK